MKTTQSGKKAANLNGHHAKKGRKATPDSPETNETHDTDGAEFPIHVLPKRLADMATAIADSRQVSREMYGRHGIPCFRVTGEGSCLTDGMRIVKRLPRCHS